MKADCFCEDCFRGVVNFKEPSRPLPEEAKPVFDLCSGSAPLELSGDITVSVIMREVEGSGPRDGFVFDNVESCKALCAGCVFSGVSPTALIPLVSILQMWIWYKNLTKIQYTQTLTATAKIRDLLHSIRWIPTKTKTLGMWKTERIPHEKESCD